MTHQKPLLSIGIIFKNEIRCIERCLKSLAPLRDALSCELVMADTGADDGSREIAEQYADILIDFPWINDFSAARNAVLDRCSGRWYMAIDCDEWIDPNIQGFVSFLTTNKDYDFASVIIRNYTTLQFDSGGAYSDFLGVRLLRMSTGIRYEGSIHEHWPYEGDLRTMLITGAVFHHDGYALQNPEARKEKQKRNMALLREKLEKEPDNLIVLTQCIESGDNAQEQEAWLRRAMVGIDEKWPQWGLFGPPIYRYAVRLALTSQLPELEEWLHKAETMFPDSIFVRVEIAYYAFGHAWNTDNYPEAIRWGEKYLQGVTDYHAGNFNRADILASSLDKTDSHNYLSVATVLASGYLHENQPEKCIQLLERLNPCEMDAKQTGDCVRNFCQLHARFDVDTGPIILRFWDQINEETPSQERAGQRRDAFLQVGTGMFETAFWTEEDQKPDIFRHAYTAFLPMENKCVLGDAAQILESNVPTRLEEILLRQESLQKFPSSALLHALKCGILFPLPGKPMNLEEMDRLTAYLAQEKGGLAALVRQIGDSPKDPQELAWARGLCMAVLKVFDWKTEPEEDGLLYSRTFAKIEKAYLPLCYAPGALNQENLFLLPPFHRFGWYLIQAFEALDSGEQASYVRLLRKGLEANEGAKDMVEFLIDHTPQLQVPPPPSAELLSIAEQIRTILSAYDPENPAVAAIKSSDAYQKVAYLIEGAEVPIVGGLVQ